MTTMKRISKVKRGEYVMLKEGGPVYARGDYDRAFRKYSLMKFDDACREVFKAGSVSVFVDFTF